LLGKDGNLYGVTLGGGAGSNGTVFKWATNSGALTTLYSFGASSNASTAIEPAPLLQGSDGTFFGTAFSGGTFNYGVIYQIDTNGVFKTLYSFDNTNGASPNSALTLNTNDGNIYGTTFVGGTNGGFGTIFKMTPSGAFTSLFSFNGTNGGHPMAQPTVGPDGKLYGTTYSGGTNDFGTIYSITTNGLFSSLFSFDGGGYGGNPHAGVIFGPDGKMYGTCAQRGANGYGSIFSMDTNGNVTTVFSFNGNNGSTPYSPLVLGQDGNFYGMTLEGGSNFDGGTIFSMSPGGTFTSLFSFEGQNGANPTGSLVKGAGNTFFGVTTQGGTNGNLGTIFQFSVAGPPLVSPTLNVVANNSQLVFTWNSIPGQTYQLQSALDMWKRNWTNQGPAITATSTTTTNTILQPTNQSVLYRLSVGP